MVEKQAMSAISDKMNKSLDSKAAIINAANTYESTINKVQQLEKNTKEEKKEKKGTTIDVSDLKNAQKLVIGSIKDIEGR